MTNDIRIANPLKFGRMTQVLRINGVDVNVHWSVFVIAGIILLNASRKPLVTIAGGLAYLSIFLIHEWGHAAVAQQKGCAVYEINLYPIFAITRFQQPWSREDRCLIYWGGVWAQAMVALPCVLWVANFGYTRFEPVNAVIAILGSLSLWIAAFNLLPLAGLDGAVAWDLVPILFERARARRSTGPPAWRR